MTQPHLDNLLFLLITWGLIGLTISYRHYDIAALRLCGSDFSTPGRCFIAANTSGSLGHREAEKYCINTYSGHLAAVEDSTSQALVEAEANKYGWTRTWINGHIKHRFWNWAGTWQYLAYQGCYNDDPDNPDLPILLDIAHDAKPADCLEMCKTRASSQPYHLGVQMTSDGKLVCRCGSSFGKHGKSTSPSCDNPCPSAGIFMQKDPINTICGGNGHQLIYYIKGTTFQAFAPMSARSNGHCAVMDPKQNYQWTECDCHDKLPFICQYNGIGETQCKSLRNYHWVDGACITMEMDPLSFYDAQGFCFQHKGALLQIKDARVQEAVKKVFDNENTQSFYIGLTNEHWQLSYWDPMFRYFNWGENQPSSGPGQVCLSIIKEDDYRWYNLDCETPLPFICMANIKPATSPKPQTTTVSPTPMADAVGMNETDVMMTTTCDSRKFMDGILIGVGAGAGGTLIIAVVVGLCISHCQRQKKSVQSEEKPPVPVEQVQRELPLPPPPNPGGASDQQQPLPIPLTVMADTNRPPSLYYNDYQRIENGGGKYQSPPGDDAGNDNDEKYEDLHRMSSHVYNDLQPQNRPDSDYLQPVGSVKKPSN